MMQFFLQFYVTPLLQLQFLLLFYMLLSCPSFSSCCCWTLLCCSILSCDINQYQCFIHKSHITPYTIFNTISIFIFLPTPAHVSVCLCCVYSCSRLVLSSLRVCDFSVRGRRMKNVPSAQNLLRFFRQSSPSGRKNVYTFDCIYLWTALFLAHRKEYHFGLTVIMPPCN